MSELAIDPKVIENKVMKEKALFNDIINKIEDYNTRRALLSLSIMTTGRDAVIVRFLNQLAEAQEHHTQALEEIRNYGDPTLKNRLALIIQQLEEDVLNIADMVKYLNDMHKIEAELLGNLK